MLRGGVRAVVARHTAPHHATPRHTAPRHTAPRHTAPRHAATSAACWGLTLRLCARPLHTPQQLGEVVGAAIVLKGGAAEPSVGEVRAYGSSRGLADKWLPELVT
eukprot:2752339-Prymnesium_polylepis.1